MGVQRGVHLHFIEPGEPIQNYFVESFNFTRLTSASTSTGSSIYDARQRGDLGSGLQLRAATQLAGGPLGTPRVTETSHLDRLERRDSTAHPSLDPVEN